MDPSECHFGRYDNDKMEDTLKDVDCSRLEKISERDSVNSDDEEKDAAGIVNFFESSSESSEGNEEDYARIMSPFESDSESSEDDEQDHARIVNEFEGSSKYYESDKHFILGIREILTLQESSLLAILQNFDRYCVAFKMPNCKVPAKNWEFLARRFSERLFHELKNTSKLRIKHLDLLINPHMKKLNIVGIDRQILPDLTECLKKYGGSILSFEAESADLRGDFCDRLMSTLKNVETIHYCCDIKESMNGLFYSYDLCEKREDSSKPEIPPICEAIGKYCASIKNLEFKFLGMLNDKTWNHGIAFILKHCPCLETLQYRDVVAALYTLHKNELPSSRNHTTTNLLTGAKYALKSLILDGAKYPLHDVVEICAATCPYVSSLHVKYLATAEQLEKISHFINLEHLHLQQMINLDISSSCLTKVLNLRGNKLISLSMTCVSGLSTETLIGSCPKLQSLALRKVQYLIPSDVTEECYRASLPDLETAELSFSDFAMPNAAAAGRLIILAAKNLKNLSLISSVGLTTEFITSLNLFNICILDATFTDIRADPLIEVLSRGNLEELYVTLCREITESDYTKMKRCASRTQRKVTIKWYQ